MYQNCYSVKAILIIITTTAIMTRRTATENKGFEALLLFIRYFIYVYCSVSQNLLPFWIWPSEQNWNKFAPIEVTYYITQTIIIIIIIIIIITIIIIIIIMMMMSKLRSPPTSFWRSVNNLCKSIGNICYSLILISIVIIHLSLGTIYYA